jgi:hypothetical protein
MIFVNGKENNNKIIQIGDKIVKLIDTLNENNENYQFATKFRSRIRIECKDKQNIKKRKMYIKYLKLYNIIQIVTRIEQDLILELSQIRQIFENKVTYKMK